MAEIPDKAKLIIDRFLSELAEDGIGIEQAILFGSYAQGTFDEWSDIDLALVSSTFEGDRFRDREKIRRIKLKVKYHRQSRWLEILNRSKRLNNLSCLKAAAIQTG